MRHSLRELTRKVDRIAASIYTLETEDIHEMRLSIEKICSMQTTLLRDCIGTRAESENSWRFYEIRDIAVELDDEYRKIQSKVIDRCNTKTDREWLLKVFLEHTSMIADITKVLSIFRGRKDRLNLLVKSSVTDGDMTKCLTEITGTQLSNLDKVYILEYIYNRKLLFLKSVADRKISIDQLDWTALKQDSELVRQKRWDIAEALSEITGLGTKENMKILERNVQRDTDRIIQDEGEILKIEKKENEILDSLKRQTDKIGSLWKDERVLQDRLKQVISEERTLIENLSFLSEGMEASSDIALEFNGFLMMLERLTDVEIGRAHV